MFVHIDKKREIPVFVQDINKEVINDFNLSNSFVINGSVYLTLKTLEKTHKNRFDVIFAYKKSGERVIEQAERLLSKEGLLVYKEQINKADYRRIIEDTNNEAIILDIDCNNIFVEKFLVELNKEEIINRKFVLCGDFEKKQKLYLKIRNSVEKNKTLNLKYYNQQMIDNDKDRKKMEQTLKLYLDELICLDNHREILDKVFTVLNTTEAEICIGNKMPDNARIYIWKGVELNKKQEQCIRKKNCKLIQIPDAYFKS